MIKTGHLGRLELFSFVFLASVADAALIYPQQLVVAGDAAGWMIPLVSTVICLGVWAVIGPIYAKRPGEDLVSLSKHTLGKFSIPIFLLISLFLFLDTTALSRGFAEAVITTVLPRSPISFISLPFLLVSVYYAYQGIEGMTRVSWLFTPSIIVGLALLMLLNANWYSLEYLFPFWGGGAMKIMTNGGLFTGVFVNLLLLSIFGSRLRRSKDVVKIGYISILAVGLVYMLITLVFILTFSSDAAMRSPFPLYQMGRLVYIGRFIQRLEAAFVFIWVALALIKVAAGTFTISYLIASAFDMPIYRPLVFPISMAMYAVMFFPEGFADLIDMNNKYILTWGWVVVILLPLMLAIWFRMRKEEQKQDETTPKSA